MPIAGRPFVRKLVILVHGFEQIENRAVAVRFPSDEIMANIAIMQQIKTDASRASS